MKKGPRKSLYSHRLLGLLILGLFIASCHPEFDYLDIDIVSGTPFPVIVERNKIRMPSGTTIIVEVEPESSRRKDYPSSADVELVSENSEVFEVREGMKEREFSFSAITPGVTVMKVYIDGHKEDSISVTVDSREY